MINILRQLKRVLRIHKTNSSTEYATMIMMTLYLSIKSLNIQDEILNLIEKTEFIMFEIEVTLYNLFTDNNVDFSVKTEIFYCAKHYQVYLSKCDKEYVEAHGSYR